MNVIIRINQHKFIYFSLCFLFLFLIIHISVPAINAKSLYQDGSEPTRLSNFNQSSLYPVLTSDNNGHLHLLWRECTGFNSYENCQVTTIYYRKWDGSRWQIPIDVFVAPEEDGNVALLNADIDGNGILHVIWTAKEGFSDSLFHSWASIHDSIDARSFETEFIDVGTNITYGDLVLDDENKIHIVFNEGNANIFYINSAFVNGKSTTWSLPINLSASLYVESPRIFNTSNGWMHATWTETSKEGFGKSIHYSRSRDGESWETPRVIFQPGNEIQDGHMAVFPNLGSDGIGRLHLVWSRGVGKPDGLYHSFSDNNGQSWSQPRIIQPGLSGSTGHNSLQIDSAGNLHLILSARVSEEAGLPDDYQGTFILHGTWDIEENRWSEMEPFTSPEYPSSEHLQAAFTNGNLLHVVWMQWINPTPIVYKNLVVNAERVQAAGYPNIYRSSGSEVSDSQSENQSEPTNPANSIDTEFISNAEISTKSFSDEPIYWPILLGTIAAGLVIFLITFFSRRRRIN